MVVITAPAPVGAGSSPRVSLTQAQPPLRIPDADFVVEVVGELPVRTKLADVTRLLGQRQRAQSNNRSYPPTILEIITLVERNPARPPGRPWNSIRELTFGFDGGTREVIVEYCLDYCDRDPLTGATHERRRLIAYRSPEQKVIDKMNKKIGELKKYAER
jgi:hypothetical protein